MRITPVVAGLAGFGLALFLLERFVPLRESKSRLAGRLLVNAAFSALPKGTAKITYTSGTTGQPKGVCLSLSQMMAGS